MLVLLILTIKTFRDSQFQRLTLVEFIYTAALTAPHFATFIDDMGSAQKIRKMLLYLFDSVAFCKSSMKTPINLKHFEQNLRWKLFLSIIIQIFCILFRLTSGNNSSLNLLTNALIFTLSIYKMIGLIQVIFFIDLSNELIFSINQKLNHFRNNIEVLFINSNDNECLNILCSVKMIHFKVWKVSKLISSRFGWLMIVTLLEMIVNPCISIFFLFVYFTGPNEWKWKAIRNYYLVDTPFCKID